VLESRNWLQAAERYEQFMNPAVKYIFLLSFAFSYSQENNEVVQLKHFEKGNENLKINDLSVAYNYFNSAYENNPESKIGKEALVKSDSIRNVLRLKLFEKVKGNWKLIGFEGKPIFDLVRISEREIIFEYQNKIVKTEKFEFKEDSRYFRYFFEFRFSDNKTWQIYLENSRLRLWNSGGRNEEGVDFHYSCGGDEFVFERSE
jgi:hypothetical protein